jgi:hypothetical protein
MGAPEGNQYALGNEGGRPTEYREEFNELAFNYSLLGCTDKEMAKFFGVSEVTLNEWKKKHEEFLKSIKAGKEDADAKVAKSLYKRAIGMDYQEVTFERVDNRDVLALDTEGNMQTLQDPWKKKVVTKFIPPDVQAQALWLKNRRGKIKVEEGSQHWSDKQETGLTSNDGNDLINAPIKFE